MRGQILVIPFHGQGHLLPSTELCKRLSTTLGCKITLVISSSLSSSVIPTPLFQISQLTPVQLPSPDPNQPHHHHANMVQPFTDLLSDLSKGPDPPICAIVDVMLNYPAEPCKQFNVPVISFFTSGACSTAMMAGLWKLGHDNLTPGVSHALPGLPDDMQVSQADFMHFPPKHGGSPRGHPRHGGPGLPEDIHTSHGVHQPVQPQDGEPRPDHPLHGGPPGPRRGGEPPWISHVEGSIAVMFNTCDDLERPFIEYVAKEFRKPVWGVGPLLPEQYWQSADSLVHDHDMRSERKTSVSEDKVNEWLETKPHGSVIFVAFGTEVCPTSQELAELAFALEECKRPFVWAIQEGAGRFGPPGGMPGFHGPPGMPRGGPLGFGGPPGSDVDEIFRLPDGFEKRVEGRGLVIQGWAPQLLILSHPSIAAFISHCGWNSTVEALARGLPLLAWPIRGDQPFNAKLVVNHLKVGFFIKVDRSRGDLDIKKHEILERVEKLMSDDETKQRAKSIRSIFSHGFPECSMASFYAFKNLINEKCIH